MEHELLALAGGPAPPAEPPFRALVEAVGGRGQVLLVGELWEREPSRAQLWDFARALFPPEPAKQGCARGAGPGVASGAPKAARPAARTIRSPLVFVLCRAASLAARGPRRRLREMLRDVRSRRVSGAALVAVLVAEAGPEDAAAAAAAAPELRLLEALLRTVFGQQAGGAVQAATYCPGRPGSSQAVQSAACKALQAAGPGPPGEEAWERPSLPGLLACFSWGPWRRRKGGADISTSDPALGISQNPEEELALTTIFPNGDSEDARRKARCCDGAHTPAEPPRDSR
ncbi:uncharacterized protein C2orf72 homolog [Rhynchocyon petersi]